MATKVTLKDGSEVLLRPVKKTDLDRCLTFFRALPERDRVYLRRDVTRRDAVKERLHEIDSDRVMRLVAVAGGKIVADGSLETSGHDWEAHVCELRLIVARPYQRKGLGARMARELFALASTRNVEEIVVKMMRPQRGARKIFRKLGFHDEVLLPDYAKDLHGKKQDLIVMRCKLEDLWREYEALLYMADFPRQ